jgi:hypothetical protein
MAHPKEVTQLEAPSASQLLDELIKEHDEAIVNAEHIEELPMRNVFLRVHQSIREKLVARRHGLTSKG